MIKLGTQVVDEVRRGDQEDTLGQRARGNRLFPVRIHTLPCPEPRSTSSPTGSSPRGPIHVCPERDAAASPAPFSQRLRLAYQAPARDGGQQSPSS